MRACMRETLRIYAYLHVHDPLCECMYAFLMRVLQHIVYVVCKPIYTHMYMTVHKPPLPNLTCWVAAGAGLGEVFATALVAAAAAEETASAEVAGDILPTPTPLGLPLLSFSLAGAGV